jgi:lipid-binding SYLF domain-containing protein
MRYLRLIIVLLVLGFAAGTFIRPNPAAGAASASKINREVSRALGDLYSKSLSARRLGEKAQGILVFPSISKGGFMVGGQFGEGALIKGGKWAAYYNTVSVSYGLQIGLQKYGYALFFMSESAMNWLDKSDGWELGTGPSIVVVDEGMAGSLTTTTAQSDIYSFFFDQKGLMGGLGLQGTKITRMKEQ